MSIFCTSSEWVLSIYVSFSFNGLNLQLHFNLENQVTIYH